MYKCLTLVALFCILGGTIEAMEKPRRTTMYVHPKNPHADKGCRSNTGIPTMALYYTRLGGYTHHPQYVWHRPSYYVRPAMPIKRQPTIIMSGDLPKLH